MQWAELNACTWALNTFVVGGLMSSVQFVVIIVKLSVSLLQFFSIA